MKKLSLIICHCLIFSTGCFAESESAPGSTRAINSPLPHGRVSVSIVFPNIFRPIGNFFKRFFGKKREIQEPGIKSVTALNLSKTEIFLNCSKNENACSDVDRLIEVVVETENTDNSVIVFGFKVSGGKILESGSSKKEVKGSLGKVFWDLSNVKPGTYTITAEVDHGCGFCQGTMTKEVKVIECPNCD